MSAARLLASCFGCGLVRPAPGTVGAAVGAVAFAFLLADRPISVQLVAVVLVTLVGVWAATAAGREVGESDPSEVVIDELAGVWIAMIGSASLPEWLLAFFAFRFFDILKPFPVGAAEALPEGWGVMADDVLAGLYSWGVVWAAGRWILT